MSVPDQWDERTIANGHWLRADFGALSLLVMNIHGEWRIASFPGGAPPGIGLEGNAAELTDEINWERWDRHPSDCRICFRPAFPSLPVIARPRSLLHLSPGGQANFFVGISASIEVLGECHGSMVSLLAVPTERLSKTWHGTPLAGSLGFALKTYARRTFEPQEWPAYDIVCAISIVNDGTESLPFERLYLETQHLAVFQKDGRLWSNAARLRVNAQEHNLSNITYASKPAAPYEDAAELTPPPQGRRRRSTIHSAFARVLGHLNPLGDPS
jgi:hypothetical protein